MSELELLKQQNEAPEWMSENGWQAVKKRLIKGETPRGGFQRVVDRYVELSNRPDLGPELFEYLWNNYIGLSTPLASNFGADRGLAISCFKTYMDDSLTGESGIFETFSEAAEFSRVGGGAGVSLDAIRGRNTLINGNGGVSGGVIPWMRGLDTTFDTVSQANRRGSGSVSLNIDHADWDAYIETRENTGDPRQRVYDLHISTRIDKSFYERLKAKDPEAERKWTKLLRYRVETGESYIENTEHINAKLPKAYVDRGMTVSNTNICCLGGDTLVATTEGAIAIKDLIGRKVSIWDGQNWVENDSFEYRGIDKLTRIWINDRFYIDANAEHRWFLEDDIHADAYIPTHLLCVGDVLQPSRSATHMEITKIEQLSGEHPVYCPRVLTTGMFGLAGGIMTGNTEILQYVDKQHSVVCCLSSLNLATYNQWKPKAQRVIEMTHRILDTVIEDFIIRSVKYKYLTKARRGAEKARAIGIGVMGWHDLLLQRDLAFDNSPEVMQLNAEIFRTIKRVTDETSKQLAIEYGEPEWLKGHGERNMFKMAVAPTKTNSFCSNVLAEGIAPFVANIYEKEGAEGSAIQVNPYLIRVLDRCGKNTTEIIKSIVRNRGSVQHLDFLTEHERKMFKTAREIDQRVLIRQTAQRQQFCDQGISLNLFFPSNATAYYINDVHILANELGIKTLYYLKSGPAISGDSLDTSCESCEG